MGAPRELLIVELDGIGYGLDAAAVRHILWLPELSPAAVASAGTIGLFNLRGVIVPVIDLARRLGRARHTCETSDQVVVLSVAGTTFGMIVNQVRDLAQLSAGDILPRPASISDAESPIATASFQFGDDLVTVLDVDKLAPSEDAQRESAELPCQDVLPAEHSLLRTRARALRQPVVQETQDRLILAVVELEGQYFGIDLHAVREFCDIGQLTPIPCCPPHVAGVFNLRGHFVTLLELSASLNLPPPAAPRRKAIISVLGEALVGMAVDDVLDVITPGVSGLWSPPAVLSHGGEIRSITPYAGRMVALLDLPALLARDEWVVDETIE